MEFSRAASQIAEIHDHLLRTEVYRGVRPLPVAASGLCGVAAAALQPLIVRPNDALAFVLYWSTAAAASGLAAATPSLLRYLRSHSDLERRKTRRVAVQFAPCLAAGAGIAIAAARLGAPMLAAVPGLWAAIFGLGVMAARPFLPRGTGVVGAYYVLVGAALMVAPPGDQVGFGRALGVTFGVGQHAAAFVLWLHRERDDNVR